MRREEYLFNLQFGLEQGFPNILEEGSHHLSVTVSDDGFGGSLLWSFGRALLERGLSVIVLQLWDIHIAHPLQSINQIVHHPVHNWDEEKVALFSQVPKIL